MILTSLPFLLFFAAVLLLYNLTPARLRWVVLLVSSYSFYACFELPHLLAALVAVTIICYFSALRISGEASSEMKCRWFWSGTVLQLGLLIGLKYAPFLIDHANRLLSSSGASYQIPANNRLVIIGVSYYVFQGISYLVDVYLEQLEPERHLGYFALYLAFFPKLLQGPIERGSSLLPQLHRLSATSWHNFFSGTNLFIWGLFKKVVIADRLAALADPVYNNVTGYSGGAFFLATYAFAWQIYFDFSGYTDMALGIARCFNLGLTQNFNAPYLASSTADFWRRWHISFSSWILDYIFKPLQFVFRQWPRTGTCVALMLTFFVSGIWHGSSYCFLVWGLLHGCYLAGANLLKAKKQKLHKRIGLAKSRLLPPVQIFCTFHIVCFAWIFFRSANLPDALYIVRHSFPDLVQTLLDTGRVTYYGSASELLCAFLLLALTGIVGQLDWALGRDGKDEGSFRFMHLTPVLIRSTIYAVMSYLIVLGGAGTQSFIYLQF